MKTVEVKGRFLDQDGNPIAGRIKFLPSRMWFNKHGVSYATMSADLPLDDGHFSVPLSPTIGFDDDLPWHYTVICPVGKWTIRVPDSAAPVFLRDMLPSRFR